jgi:hypothetical protein
LTVTQDSSLGSQTLAQNSINQKIGSFSFTASQSEGVTVSNLTIGVNSGVSTNQLANLKVMVNGQQFGSTQPTVAASADTYNFSGTPFTVPAGGTTVVGVYADILSGATINAVPVYLSNFSGTGATSYTAVSTVNGHVQGQNLQVASGGSSITASVNTSYQPANGQLSMGTTGDVLASLNFNETSNTEDVKLTSMDLFDVSASASGTAPSFSNLTLWNGSQEVGSVQSYTATTTVGGANPAFVYAFTNLLSNAVGTAFVPRNSVLTLTLKGDVNTFTSGNAVDLSSHVFEIATSTSGTYNATGTVLVAQGATSGKTANVVIPHAAGSGAISGATTQQVLQNALVFSWTPVGTVNGRGKSTSDEIADLTFNAANGGSLELNNATITFSGTGASSATSSAIGTGASGFMAGVKLLDPSGNAVAIAATSSDCATAAGPCTIDFTFAGRQVNGSQTYKLVVDDSKAAVASGNSSVSLYATIAAPGDVTYTDAVTGGTATTLPTILQPGNQIFPLNLNSITYSQGT